MISETNLLKPIDEIDSVVMVTWSDWKTEPRSNRYHYAKRLSRHWPVIFIQPDLPLMAEPAYKFEPTELPNVTLLHVSPYGDSKKNLKAWQEAFAERGVHSPLMWIYNFTFHPIYSQIKSPFQVYHATEDYFDEFHNLSEEQLSSQLVQTLAESDLLVACAPGVLDSYQTKGQYTGPSLVLQNGCDAGFYCPNEDQIDAIAEDRQKRKIVFYQGGIQYHRLDFELMRELAEDLSDWEFWFAGRPVTDPATKKHWKKFTSLPNVKALGFLEPEQIRERAYLATVGLMPYRQIPVITDRSFPLKAYEYMACGLPVVSVPIKALESHELFDTATNAKEFAQAIRAAEPKASSATEITARVQAAKLQDYDKRFEQLMDTLKKHTPYKADPENPLNILVMFDDQSMHVLTCQNHLQAFADYSHHNIHYIASTHDAPCDCDLEDYDVVIIHYTVRVPFLGYMSSKFEEKLKTYSGTKVLMVQDDYDHLENTHNFIKDCSIDLVLTVVPEPLIEQVYPAASFPNTKFAEVLTGYVPQSYNITKPSKAFEERAAWISYRGRALPHWYGMAGQEKVLIGKRMKEICKDRDIPADIGWENEDRIYGDAWLDFLQDSRVMLGCEGGSSFIDFDGKIVDKIKAEVAANPNLPFDEAYEKFMKGSEWELEIRTITPKFFEAIACKTGLVLFEGEYNDILKPWKHYIPLKRDYSNVDEVFEKVASVEYLEELTHNAYEDIIASGRYSYETSIREVEMHIARLCRQPKAEGITPALSWPAKAQYSQRTQPASQATYPINMPAYQIYAYKQPPAPPAPTQVIQEQVQAIKEQVRHRPFPGRKYLVKALAPIYYRVKALRK